MIKVCKHQSWEKAGVPVKPLPESGYLRSLVIDKERKAPSIARINPLAVLVCDVAAEYSDFATFFVRTIFHNKLLSSLEAKLKLGGCLVADMWSFHHRQQRSPKLTGQRALSFFEQRQEERHCGGWMPLKRSITPNCSRCKSKNKNPNAKILTN